MQTIIASIQAIHPSAYSLLWFWHSKSIADCHFLGKPFNERDSYERVDNYNAIGVAMYFVLKLDALFSGNNQMPGWNLPQSHLFTYEVMQKFL